MDLLFVLKLFLSFCIGGSWVVLTTVLADKFGSKIGGLVSGFPSTIIFGLFFIAWTQNTVTATQSTTIIPIIGGINCVFLMIYILLVHKSFWIALTSSLMFWTLTSWFLIRIHFDNYPISLIGFGLLYLISFFTIERFAHITSVKGKTMRYSPMMLGSRAILGGVIVAAAVLLGKIGGPIFGGMFSMFPAMFISTIFVTHFAHGSAFSAGTMKTSMISGISIIVYSVVVRYTYVPYGVVIGSMMAFVGSLIMSLLVYKTIIMKAW